MSITKKLFYEDSHIQSFCAVVQACVPEADGFSVRLNQTAFFPEGGGQYADEGTLENIQVFDVQEKDGEIWHKTKEPLQEGATVRGQIDWEERLMKMQQHTGEHIVSGLVHAAFGYNNVGFHLGREDCTMDFDGEITKEQLHEIEKKANQIVFDNRNIQVTYPNEKELEQLEYRSKIEIEGQVRIVTIPGVDVCACCAPHVKMTGEIGLIKFVNVQRYKGGARVTMLCGVRAFQDYHRKHTTVRQLSAILCAKEEEIVSSVETLREECAAWKAKVQEYQKQVLVYKVKEVREEEDIVCLFETQLTGELPRYLMNLLLERGHRICAVFSGNDTDGYRYVIGSRQVDLRKAVRELNETFHGKGGGKPEMVQGSLKGNQKEIKLWLEEKARTL